MSERRQGAPFGGPRVSKAQFFLDVTVPADTKSAQLPLFPDALYIWKLHPRKGVYYKVYL